MTKLSIMTKHPLYRIDDRRSLVVPGDTSQTINFCAHHFLKTAQSFIDKQGYFAVALSGGGTPKAIFQKLALSHQQEQVDWSKVLLFWGDERNVPPNHPDSNYNMAMKAGFAFLPISPQHIFRMPTDKEESLVQGAQKYAELITTKIPGQCFDMIMLGVGEDGHTASLFPHTQALHVTDQLVTANFAPTQKAWRMTLTYPCINAAKNICIYALGKSKAKILETVLCSPLDAETLPVQAIGTPANPALWFVDEEASHNIAALIKQSPMDGSI